MLQPRIKLVTWILGLIHISAVYSFRDGDYIQTARKAQFHQSRTHWHDLVGHHCPRFGHDRLVAMPLQQPVLNFTEIDEYKIQLSFDGDRHVTPWLKVLGKGVPGLPMVEVELRRSGEELIGVSAKVVEAGMSYQHSHQASVSEFHNVSAWPKHLLVKYRFKTENDVDLDRGLHVLFAIGMLATLLLAVNAARGVQPKLAQFFSEMTREEAAPGAALWTGGSKAE